MLNSTSNMLIPPRFKMTVVIDQPFGLSTKSLIISIHNIRQVDQLGTTQPTFGCSLTDFTLSPSAAFKFYYR